MKTTFLLFVLFLSTNASKECDPFLLESYDIPGTRQVQKELPLICPAVKNNCCTKKAELKIYQKWVINKERNKILDIYKEFMNTYNNIFDTFERIENFATIVEETTADGRSPNCNKLAKAIREFEASKFKAQVNEAAKKAFKFLYISRRGFYCSLCEQKNHKFYDLDSMKIASSASFCSDMVSNTFNHFVFKYVNFMKISRLYGEFITKCDLYGNYGQNQHLKYSLMFFKETDIMVELDQCKNNLKSENAYEHCAKYCEHFHPIKFDQMLEGQLGQFYEFEKTLRKAADNRDKVFNKKTKINELSAIFSSKKRLLEEAPAEKPADAENKEGETPKDEEEPEEGGGNEITKFNKLYKTKLLRPVTFNFDNEILKKHMIDFDEPIVDIGVARKYKLVEFGMVNQIIGVNFSAFGRSALINKENAIILFNETSKIQPPQEDEQLSDEEKEPVVEEGGEPVVLEDGIEPPK